MGLFSFGKKSGAAVFKKETAAPAAQSAQVKAQELLNYVKGLGLPYQNIRISLRGDDVVLEGQVDKQSDSERIVLAVGNVEGVDTVDNNMRVNVPQPESKYHTVVSGDSLSKIAKTVYGNAMKYPIIFEANKPMLDHPDKIYPGQVLRIPNL
jgi:nucleoid-associated protein YgaU